MSKTFSQDESRQMLKWLNQNRQMLLDLYRNQYIAYNANDLIAHSESLREVLDLAEASNQPFAIYLVPRRTASIQILPIRFRTTSDEIGESDFSDYLSNLEDYENRLARGEIQW
jgi:hypothetical protein